MTVVKTLKGQARNGYLSTHFSFFCQGGWEGWSKFVRGKGRYIGRYIEGRGKFVGRYEGFR